VSSVVTVHGLWMRGASMALLRRRLEPQGFRIYEFTYRSVTRSLADNAAALAAFVAATPGDTVHLIGHSLGGAVIREMLDRACRASAVMAGSPLRVGQAARHACRSGGVGRSVAELNARGGFAAWVAGIEAGSIAGRVPLGLGRLFGRFPEPNDGTVAVAETQLDGARDHLVLPVSHFALLWSRRVAEQVEHFLARALWRARSVGESSERPELR
jgi:pimeloyl-ACP methyl ester carboxylesterase